MRTIELALISVTVLAALSVFYIEARKLKTSTIVGIISITIIHVIIEGFRWQMVPAYFLAIVIIYLLKRKDSFLRDWRRYVYILFLMIWTPIAILLPVFVPVFHIKAPTGPYQTGTVSYKLPESSNIMTWYPAIEAKNPVAPYFPDIDFLTEKHHHLLLSHLTYVESNSEADAPIATSKDKFPVVVLTHEFIHANFLFTSLAEELASHGYIVFINDSLVLPQIIELIRSLNQKDPILKGRMDLDKFALIQHSIERKASLMIIMEANLSTPSLYIGDEERNFHGFYVRMKGIKKMSFTDYYHYSPYFSISEKVNHLEDRKIISTVILQFLNKQFFAEKGTMFDTGKSPFPRLTITSETN